VSALALVIFLGLFPKNLPPRAEAPRPVSLLLEPAREAAVRIGAPGLEVTIEPTGRQAEFVATYPVENASDSPLEAHLVARATHVPLRIEWASGGGQAPVRTERESDLALVDAPDLALDPVDGGTYAIAGKKLDRARRLAFTIPLGPRQRGVLILRVSGSPGIDRARHNRTLAEIGHYFRKRNDPFTYQYVALVPEGPVTVRGGPDQHVAHHRQGDALLVASTERALDLAGLPLGLALGAGTTYSGSGIDPRLRLAIDVIVPGGHLALAGEDDPTGPATVALAYRLMTPYQQFVPIGAHLELGGALDVYPTVRPAVRSGVGFHLLFFDFSLSLDLFPREPDLGWRIGAITSFSM
jgi:hypothetical protein